MSAVVPACQPERTAPSGLAYKQSFSWDQGAAKPESGRRAGREGSCLSLEEVHFRAPLKKRAESKAGLLTHPPTSQRGSVLHPSLAHTLCESPPPHLTIHIGASTSATNFPTGLFSVYKANPENQEEFTEPSVSDGGPSLTCQMGEQGGFWGQAGLVSNFSLLHSLAL